MDFYSSSPRNLGVKPRSFKSLKEHSLSPLAMDAQTVWDFAVLSNFFRVDANLSLMGLDVIRDDDSSCV